MARLESKALAGFYPTPSIVIELLMKCFTILTSTYQRSYFVFDPCCGDGSALALIRKLILEKQPTGNSLVVQTVGYELERERAIEACKLFNIEPPPKNKIVFRGYDNHGIVNSNFFLCSVASRQPMSLVFLNPPYDTDQRHRRLEQAFLAHLTPQLLMGSILVFVVPFYALKACAETLAKNYSVIGCWKFPDPEFDQFQQVVLVAQKEATTYHPSQSVMSKVLEWSEGKHLQPLTDVSFRFQLNQSNNIMHDFSVRKIDEFALLGKFKPFHATMKSDTLQPSKFVYPSHGIKDLLQQSYPIATYPKQAHVTTAVASGVFNGAKVSANKGLKLPNLLVKGVFDKDFRTVDTKVDNDGKVKSLVQIQQPKLTVTVFDLQSKEFREIPGSTIINDNIQSIDAMTIPDLLNCYSDDLLSIMLKQCQVQYIPERDRGKYILPRSTRRPYKAQADATRALVNIYQTHKSAILLGEIGCGKTTVALLTAKMIKAKRVLVLCPPHLLHSWQEQTISVYSNAKSIVIRSVDDIETFQNSEGFIVGIMSREAAKLDHKKESVQGVCSCCGYTVETKDYTKKREKCSNVKLDTSNVWAGAILSLARLVNMVSDDPIIRTLLPQRVYARRYAKCSSNPEQSNKLFLNRLKDNPRFEWLIVQLIESLHLLPYDNIDTFSEMISMLCAWVCSDLKSIFDRIQSLKSKQGPYGGFCYSGLVTDILCMMDFNDEGHERKTYKGKTVVECLIAVINYFSDRCKMITDKKCNAPLYYSTPQPRRVDLSSYIAKKAKNCFDFLILDEGHEYSTDGSAQEIAAHRLVQLNKPTLLMTGSIMNGYAHSLFSNLWYLSDKFREEFDREDLQRFVDRYGYRKQIVECKDTETGKVVEFGTVSDRVVTSTRKVGVAPGVLPLLVIKHILPIAVTLHKADLALELPRCVHMTEFVECTEEQFEEYTMAKNILVTTIKQDMFTPLAGKLWGQMAELPSILDRCATGTGNTPGGEYVIRYPESVGGEVLSITYPLTEGDELLPKEQWLIEKISEELAEGRDCLVYSWHVVLLPRLKRIIEKNLGIVVAVMDSKKVPTHERQQWIESEVLDKGRRVLILNPVGVKTGINNLVAFSTIIWFENPACNPEIYRQAIGRIDRIGQTKETRVFFPVYKDTLQIQLHKLLMAKVAVSLQTDGLDSESALIAAGAGDSEAFVFDNIGKLLFDMIQKEQAA